MAKQTINVGTTANDRKGDSLRAAFQKVNENFTELYTLSGSTGDLTELAQDAVAQMIVSGSHQGVTVSYNDTTNKLNFVVEQDLDGGSASTVFDDDNTIDGGGA